MTRPWKPKKGAGWAGQWDRHRWAMATARKPKSRAPGLRGFTLMVVAGVSLGSLYAVATSASAAWPASAAAETGLPAAVRVIDGDTFDLGGERIRIADIDTPERHGRCPAETRLAARATARIRVLLAEGPFELHRTGARNTDRHGRKLRIVTRHGRSLGDRLVAEGLARTWTGRREPWCA